MGERLGDILAAGLDERMSERLCDSLVGMFGARLGERFGNILGVKLCDRLGEMLIERLSKMLGKRLVWEWRYCKKENKWIPKLISSIINTRVSFVSQLTCFQTNFLTGKL